MKISKDSNGVHADEEAQAHWASVYEDKQKRFDKSVAILKSHKEFYPEMVIIGVEELEALAMEAEEGKKGVMKGKKYAVKL